MFKNLDPVVAVRMESTVRQATTKERQNADCEAWITEKAKEVKTKGVIGKIDRLYLPVVLNDGSVVQKLAVELTERGKGKSVDVGDVVYFGYTPRHKEIVDGHKVLIKGKAIRVRGKLDRSLDSLHIPVILEGQKEETMIPFHNLVFKGVK